MKTENLTSKADEIALFRYSLISEIIHRGNYAPSVRDIVKKTSLKTFDIPYSKAKKVSMSTIYTYLKKYRKSGFKALMPKERKDKGKSRAFESSVCDEIEKMKREDPRRSSIQIIKLIQANPKFKGIQLSARTVSRYLKQHGLCRKQLLKSKKRHFHFQMDNINDLWECDISDGIYIHKLKKMTYLFGFIDDHSRLIPHAEFYEDEKLVRLEDCLKKAILKRGIPDRIYADNGKIFISNHFKRICSELNIKLINHLPYSPQSKGKIERFFYTAQRSFFNEIRNMEIDSLEELNSFFHAWLEIEYHRKEHSSIATTPLNRFTADLKNKAIRKVESLEDIYEIFLWRDKRKVNQSGIIKFQQNNYRVNCSQIFNKYVSVRFDPYDITKIFIYDDDKYIETAFPYIITNSVFDKVPEEIQKDVRTIKESSTNYFMALKEKEKELLKNEFNTMDYTKFQKISKEKNDE